MRDPRKRTHVRKVIGPRHAPWPPVGEHLRPRLGYPIRNHVREGWSQIATGLSRLEAHEEAAQSAGASPVCSIQTRTFIESELGPVSNSGARTNGAEDLGEEHISVGSFKSVVTSAGLLKDSPLLFAQLQVQQLVAANRRKDEFLAFLAHELRSPLGAIGYAVGLLRKDSTDSGRQQPLQALIERQVLRMTQLVDEVLDVSRITNGLLNLHNERVDLRVVIIHAMETLQSDIKGRKQHLSSCMPEVPVWVMGDERRLEQIFVNLLANASRYTDNGGQLTTWLCTEGAAAVIRIRDSGIGMAPESLSGIFELFRQANEADPRSKAGLGVGLALVRQLVDLHGGRVTAASEGIGRGSEFTISLPIHPHRLPVTVEMGEESVISPAGRTSHSASQAEKGCRG